MFEDVRGVNINYIFRVLFEIKVVLVLFTSIVIINHIALAPLKMG